jgi:predicted permease
MVLTPALLFRTMSSVHIQDLDFGPVGIYFVAFGVVYAATLAVQGFSRLGAARALANTFSNTLMIGVPLVGLVFGDAGLVTLFTLISVHSLILLTAATVVFELAAAREHAATTGGEGGAPQPLWRTVLQAIRNGIVHPVPLPIIAGLLFAQTGLAAPPVVDKPLMLLGQALGPIALLLVGVTLAFTRVGHHFKAALRIAVVKCVAHPLVLAALGWALGLSGVPLAVMIVAASLPVGANVFLFSQRYGVAEDEVTASVAVSTALAMVTMPVAILLVTRYVA